MTSAARDAWTMFERHSHTVLLALVMLLGILVRAPGFGCAFGPDDVLSAESFLRWGPQRFLLCPYYNNNHPFASLCSWAACFLFGDKDWAIKLPAFLFGIAAIPAIDALGQRLFQDRRCGLAAALLLAAIPAHVGYSTAFRGYSAAIFFAIASALFLYESLRRPSAFSVTGLSLSIALLGLSHLSFMLLMGSCGAIVAGYGLGCALMREHRSRKSLIAFVLTVLALGAGMLFVAIGYWPTVNLIGETCHRLSRGSWSQNMAGWMTAAAVTPGMFSFNMMTEVVTGFTGRAFWFASALAVFGCVGGAFQRSRGAAICVAGLVLPLAISRVAGLNPIPRFLLMVLPFFVLALGAGIVYVSDATGWAVRWILPFRIHRIAFCGLMAIVLWGFAPIYRRDFPHGHESTACNFSDYQSALRRAVAEMDPNDVVDCLWFFQPVDYYLDRIEGKTAFPLTIPSAEYRLWILMFSDARDFEGFPLQSEPELIASFRGCTLWAGQPFASPLREVPLAPLVDPREPTGNPGRWRENGSVVEGMHVETDSETVRVCASRTVCVNWGLTQDRIPVGERKRVIFRAQVRDDSGRRLTRLWLCYLDADGNWSWEHPRFARRAVGEGPWRWIQLSILTPKRTAFIQPEIRVEGMLRAGEEVRFRNPQIWIEGESPEPQVGERPAPS